MFLQQTLALALRGLAVGRRLGPRSPKSRGRDAGRGDRGRRGRASLGMELADMRRGRESAVESE